MKKRPSFGGRLMRLGVFMILVAFFISMIPVRNQVPYVSQLPEFPNGCEVASLSMALGAYGYPVDPGTLHDGYMPTAPVGMGDPRYAYLGDPRGEGYYSYPRPLADAANAYLKENNAPYKALTHPLMPYLELAWHVHRGHPVIAWYTVDDQWPAKIEGWSWESSHGYTVEPYRNLHVFVLDGIEGPFLHVQDPLHGTRRIPLWEFLPKYYSMGLRAMTIVPDPVE